jgi:hypothetical protein
MPSWPAPATGSKCDASFHFGWRVCGLGVMAMGMVCLALGDFDPGQPVPDGRRHEGVARRRLRGNGGQRALSAASTHSLRVRHLIAAHW